MCVRREITLAHATAPPIMIRLRKREIERESHSKKKKKKKAVPNSFPPKLGEAVSPVPVLIKHTHKHNYRLGRARVRNSFR